MVKWQIMRQNICQTSKITVVGMVEDVWKFSPSSRLCRNFPLPRSPLSGSWGTSWNHYACKVVSSTSMALGVIRTSWSSKFPYVLLLNITMSYRLIIPTILAYYLLCFRAVSPFLFCEYVHSMVCNHHPSPAFLKAICWALRTGRRWKRSRSREVTVGLRENHKETGKHKL